MRYINKAKRQKEFDQYTLAYLRQHKQRDGSFKPRLEDSDSYSGFSRRTLKHRHHRQKGWLSVLLEEQGYRCCYCMKHLRPNEVSVEHLVPERFTGLDEDEEFEFYCQLSPRICEYIELGSSFDKKRFGSGTSLNNLVKMPHMIAHSNLFASCLKRKGNGEAGCSCNNHRGNRRILPLMLIPNVERIVFYEKSGDISILSPDIDSVEATLRNLGLNGNTLRQIRHLWYLSSRSGLTVGEINQLNDAQRIDFLLYLFKKDEIWKVPREYHKYFGLGFESQDAYWQLFLQYDWFFHYYTRHFA